MPYLLGASFYLRNKETGGKIPKRKSFVEKGAGSTTPIAAQQFYWCITMRCPRRDVTIRIEN